MPLRRPASEPGFRILDLLGWAGRTDVERVQRYTEWSLNTMIWFFLVVYASPVLPRVEGPVVLAGTVVVLVALGVVGSRAVKASAARWPRHGVPARDRWFLHLVSVLAFAVVWMLVIDDPDHIGWPMGVAMVAAWGFGGLRSKWLHVIVLVGCFLLGWASSGLVGMGAVVAGFAAFMVFTMQSSLWLLGVVRELDSARRAEAELAVARERLRFSGDVHDVMGRHLSTIAVQAELAGALLRKGDARAVERIEQIRLSAHDALREARELARGYRPLDLTQEVEGAVSLLASAGVHVEVAPNPVADAVPRAWHEPVAKVIREAVTNVLRHSRATRVSVSMAEGALRIVNDGVGASHQPSGDGSGLGVLSADVATRGGSLSHTREGERFVLTLTLPVGAWDEEAVR